jgi:hypothetical protein
MLKSNRDILYLIFKELQNNKKALYSCLTVNKTWCEIIIPILWKNPWRYLKGNRLGKKLFLNIIISHLSDVSINNLKSQGVEFFTNSYQKPLFDYLSFYRYLNLNNLNEMIETYDYIDEESIFSIIRREILNLFINENTRLTHLRVPYQFDYPIHLIPGANICFSNLEFLSCNTSINNNVLVGLTLICKSIKELELIVEKRNNNYRIIELIEGIERLLNIRILTTSYSKNDESFCKILENSLIKHSNSIRHFKITKQPNTKIISSFVNLNRLELKVIGVTNMMTWNYLENLSLPFLQILKARRVPIKVLTNLIENTKGSLIKIKIYWTPNIDIDNKRIIQAIYQNCPKLKYLKLLIRNSNILELENLLINCKYLNGLYIIIDNSPYWGGDLFNWDKLFEVLTRSSPTDLFKFKFHFDEAPKLESLKLFLDNWKNRHFMLLKTIQENCYMYFDWSKYWVLIEEYKSLGIIKKYTHVGF